MHRYVKKGIKYMLLAFFMMLIVLFAALYYLLSTTGGLRYLIDTTNSLLKDTVEITADIKEGSVLDGFHTDSLLKVDVKDVVIIKADRFHIDYKLLGYLVTDIFRVEKLEADKLEVILTYESEPEDENEIDPDPYGDNFDLAINFPVKIKIEDLFLKDFAYLSDIVDVRVKSGHLKLEASGDTAKIVSGYTDDVDVHLKYESEEEDSPLNEVKGFDDGNGKIDRLYTVRLPLHAVIDNFSINRGRYHMDGYDTGTVYAFVSADWSDTKLTVNSVRASHNLGSVSAKGSMDFTRFYTMDFDIHGNGHQNYYNLSHYDGSLYSLSGNGTLKGDLVDLNLKAHLDRPSEVDFDIRLNSLSDLLPVSLNLCSDKITYPLNETMLLRNPKLNFKNNDFNTFYEYYVQVQKELSPEVKEDRFTRSRSSLSDVKLNLEGYILDNMNVNFSAIANGLGFKNLRLNLNSETSLTKSTISSLSIKGITGTREVNGNISGLITYDDEYSFTGQATLCAGDIGGISEYLEGEFSFDIQGDAHYRSDNDSFSVHVEDLDSTFSILDRKTSFEAKNLNIDSNRTLNFDLISIRQADNFLSLKGNAQEDEIIRGEYDFKELKLLYPGVDGSLSGRLNIKGDLYSPKISLVGKSDFLRFKDVLLSDVALDLIYDTQKQSFSNALIAKTVRLPKIRRNYSNCSVDLSGSVENHDATINCGTNEGSFASAHGSYDRENSVYKGKVSNLVIVTKIIDTIYLEKPVEFDYEIKSRSGSFSDISLKGGTANLVFTDGQINPGSFSSRFKIDNLNLNVVSKLLPEGFDLTGTLDGRGSYRYADGYSFIESDMTASSGIFKHDSLVLPYENAKLELSTNQHSIDSHFDLNFAKRLGSLKLNASISDYLSSRKLSGDIDLRDFNLILLSNVNSSVNSVLGKANIKGNLGGTLEHPMLFGNAKVAGEINPTVNIGYIDKFELNLNANGDNGSVDGVVSLNQSNAYIKGDLNWKDKLSGQLNLNAESLPVFLMGKGEAYTDITAKATFGDNIAFNGDVFVKSARIKFKDLETKSVSPSSDVIFVNEKSNLYTEAKKSQINSAASVDDEISINVKLSDNIKVDALGVKGRLEGGVSINKEAGKRKLRSSGKISLVNGRADLYGHKFVVNKADSVFKDDIDNPLLYAEVVCDPSYVENDVLAGVKITGRAKDPAITLFSNPAMSQNEILSYILYGHGLEKTSDTNADRSSTQFLTSIGLGTTSGLLNSIVGVFGMDGVQIGSSGTGNDSQVELQTYITSKIRLSYGYGIFNSVQEFKLRYEIMNRLYAEIASSVGDSIDLIYSFESD